MRLTETAIKKLKAPDKRRDVRDDFTTGLYLRLMPTGRKVWRYRYQLRGKTRIKTIGEWPETDLATARDEATSYAKMTRKGDDPAAIEQKAKAERRSMPTVEEFISEYVKRYAKKKKKSWKQDQQILTRWLVPRIGRLRMDEVTRRDIQNVLDDCRDTGATRQPGKVLAVTRMLFKFGIERGVIESTPCMLISESQPEPAQRAMSEDEIRTWWTATGEALEADKPRMLKSTALALRVLLLTGQRPGEVAEMTRDELHLDSEFGPHWIISGSRRKKGRAKTGKPHAVALEPEAVTAIEQALEYSGSDWVFEKPIGGPIRTDSHMSQSLGRVFEKPSRLSKREARKLLKAELSNLKIKDDTIKEVCAALDHDDLKLTSARNILKDALTIAEIEEPHVVRILETVYPTIPTPHAARHTVATELADLRIDEYRIGRVLGHGSKTVTGTVYINNRINEPALKNQRTLLASWEARLHEVLTGKKPSKVTAIR